VQDRIWGYSALHETATIYNEEDDNAKAKITTLLLLAGADPYIEDYYGRTPLQRLLHVINEDPEDEEDEGDQTCIALLQEAVADGGRTFLLHKARHLSDTAHTLKETLELAGLNA
jgi:hypothetical protein